MGLLYHSIFCRRPDSVRVVSVRRFYTAREDQSPEIVIGYSVLLRIGHFELHDVDIYASRSISEIILGRDVLNRLTFTYDGPQSILEILDAG